MGLFNLSRLCVAFFLISAVNVASANYIYDHTTRSWRPTATTSLTPPNASSTFRPNTSIPPNPRVNNGGFTTSMGGSFGSSPVNGTTRRVPVTMQGTATRVNVNKSLASRLTRGGLAGVALGYGIQSLLNGLGWIINEGGKVSRLQADPSAEPPEQYSARHYPQPVHPDQMSTANCVKDANLGGCIQVGTSGSRNLYCNGQFPVASDYAPFIAFSGGYCYYLADADPDAHRKAIPVPADDISDAIDKNYNPDPSDYDTISGEPSMSPTQITIDPIAPLDFPSVITTDTDLGTGETTTTETDIRLDYDIRDNGTQEPKIEETKTEKKDTYKDGVKTGTSTTTSSSGVATGGSSAPSSNYELPPFCSWAGIICDWIGWTQEPLDDEPDLSALITDEEYERNYSISFGDSSCPAPITINVTFLRKSVELSYEPACELAHYAKPFVLISAYIFAIMITLGVVRNG